MKERKNNLFKLKSIYEIKNFFSNFFIHQIFIVSILAPQNISWLHHLSWLYLKVIMP